MKPADIGGGVAKLELALKTLHTTLASVDQQWTDAARRDFQTMHLASVDPNVRNMREAVIRLADAVAAAERQCGDE
ncbi:MAG: hypothetical protein LLF97_01420 [Planctomycetaceae bacterium]|nr:hypothetical protein [Planctomycetaceae bacterium]